MSRRGVIYAVASALIVCALWFARHVRDAKIDAEILSPVLKNSDTAKVIVDPRRHTLVTVTRNSAGKTETRGTFLPDAGASVELGKSGAITVSARTWGTEVRPFVGGAFGSDVTLRAALGLDLFYWYRWELGGGLLSGSLHDARLFMHVSYNVYDNWFVSLGADNRGTAHVIAGLKF